MTKITYFALGGTIASARQSGASGAAPSLSAGDLLRAAGLEASSLHIEAVQFMQVASPEITLADLIRLNAAIVARAEAGAQGFVISQGTDTLEETAFFLDLMWTRPEPIVVTGAMRNPSLPGADGPANLQAALLIAASPRARNIGVMAAFNDEIHAARFVRKTHTANPATFRSAPLGPIGWMAEGQPVMAMTPVRPFSLPAPASPPPPVALFTSTMGDDGLLFDAVTASGYKGLVVEAFGGGHVRAATVPKLEALANIMPVVLASRTGGGEMLRATYGFPGGEMDLLSKGLIGGASLDGLKCRLLLSLCLAHGLDRAAIAAAFAAWRGPEQM